MPRVWSFCMNVGVFTTKRHITLITEISWHARVSLQLLAVAMAIYFSFQTYKTQKSLGSSFFDTAYRQYFYILNIIPCCLLHHLAQQIPRADVVKQPLSQEESGWFRNQLKLSQASYTDYKSCVSFEAAIVVAFVYQTDTGSHNLVKRRYFS